MARSEPIWPDWWYWELDCTNPHLAKRMLDRGFNETDLREMLQVATGFSPSQEINRWIIKSAHLGKPWEVIVQPDNAAKMLVVVTAYTVE